MTSYYRVGGGKDCLWNFSVREPSRRTFSGLNAEYTGLTNGPRAMLQQLSVALLMLLTDPRATSSKLTPLKTKNWTP